jgi:tellurite resistance protein TerC
MDKPLWMWGAFLGVVIVLLILDLGFLHKKEKEISIKESLLMSAFYITIGLLFGGFVWLELGATAGKEYITGFIVEKTLALDNIFVISLVFAYFAVPRIYQHRVLFWGILGVIVLRAIMIGLGAAIVSEFSWVLYIFAIFLIVTGVKMFFMVDKEMDIANNPLLKFMKKRMRIANELHGKKFSVMLPAKDNPNKNVRWFTPLFVALIIIEFVDLIFAVDSVPAIFAITTDPYIVYTSNIFAILGLRALYFALNAVIHRFKYLKYSLAMVLVFIGGKVVVAGILGIEKVPPSISLSVTAALLFGGVIYSLIKTKKA